MTHLIHRIFLLTILLFGFLSLALPQSTRCPQVALVGPAGILQPGDEYEAWLESKTKNDLTGIRVAWNVENGDILTSENLVKVRFRAPIASSEQFVKVSAKVMKEAIQCEMFLSEQFRVAPRPPIADIFPYYNLAKPDVLAVIDNVMTLKNSAPKLHVLFKIRFKYGASSKYKSSRLKLIDKFFELRKYSMKDVWIELGQADDTENWLVYTIPPEDLDLSRMFKLGDLDSNLKTVFRDK